MYQYLQEHVQGRYDLLLFKCWRLQIGWAGGAHFQNPPNSQSERLIQNHTDRCHTIYRETRACPLFESGSNYLY